MNRKSESGQAIVLLVFAVIGLIGFTALAIDGGSLYADRRQAQSASDASSLAGGGRIAEIWNRNHINYDNFSCSSVHIVDSMNQGIYKAQERAGDNDYLEEEIGVATVCEDNGPLFDEKYIDISTNITRTTQTSFIQVLYDGPATNEVRSVARVRPTAPIAFGNAIVALNEEACSGNKNGMIMGGSNQTLVENGGIWSNGCMVCEGLNGKYDDDGNYVYPVQVIDAGIGYVGTLSNCDSDDLDPYPTHFNDPIPYSSYSVPPPNCNHPDAITVDSIDKNTTLQSGKLYCITNDKTAIKIPSGYLYGTNVTLYVVNGGDIEINGDVVVLTAPKASPDPSPAIAGLLIYVNEAYRSIIKINGNVESSYMGMIFAPNADIDINGEASVADPDAMVTFYTQIIGLNVHVTGNAVIDILFDEGLNLPKPAYIDLLD